MENIQDSWSGKTSPEHSQVTKAKTSDASSKKSSASQSREFLYLDLRKAESGHTQEQSWETDIRSLGEPLTLNTGESPKEDAESTLSQILEVDAHPKYYLSAKACRGILRRAASRGKVLPEILEKALHSQIRREEQSQSKTTQTIAESGSAKTENAKPSQAEWEQGGGNVPLLLEPVEQQETPKVLRMRSGCEGGGKGPLIQDDKAGTITCNNDQVLFAFGLSSKDSNAMKSSNPNSGFYEAETSRTLDCKGGNPTCNQGGIVIVQEQKTYRGSTDLVVFEPGSASRIGGHIYEDGKTGTLRANPGDNQQAVAIPIEGNGQRPSHKGDGWNESDKSYTLNATEQHGVAYRIDRAALNQGVQDGAGGRVETYQKVTGPLMANSHPGSYTGQDAFSDMLVATLEHIVRRLTPMECARLQGFPDDWTDDLIEEKPAPGEMRYWMQVWLEHWAVIGRPKGIKKPKTEKQVKKWLATEPSDGDKYKLWGNGIALPCAFYVFEGIREVLDSQEAE